MQTTCPTPDRLEAAINGHLTEVEQSDIIKHLDGCNLCQSVIEKIAVGSSHIISVGEITAQKPPGDSAYWSALSRVEEEMKNNITTVVPHLEERTRQSDGVNKNGIGNGSTSKIRKPASPLDGLPYLEPSTEQGVLGYLDHFKIISVVGRGGMGVVLEAIDTRLSRTVAIKVLDPQLSNNEVAQGRFCREARAAAAVGHENVVTIHHVEYDEERGISYIVMHFVRGRSLQEWLDMEEKLSIIDVVRIAGSVAAGLAAAHANHLIHRDVKPANILIDKQTGRVMLTDFGLARGHEDVKLTQTGFVAGTPLYMSPEQARGEVIVDPRSDLFSLGGVLYTMLTGRPPFPGNSAFGVLRGVTDNPHRPVQEIRTDTPDWLANLLDRLLAKSPVERPSSAQEVSKFLQDQYVRLAVIPASSPKNINLGTPRRRTWFTRHATQILAAAGAVGLILGATELSKLSKLTVVGQRGTKLVEKNDIPPTTLPTDIKLGPEPKYQTTRQTGAILSVAFSPGSDTLASSLEDGTVKLWESSTGRAKGLISMELSTPIWNIAFNEEGTHLATASDDGFVRLWDITKPREPVKSFPHTYAVRAISFSPKGDKIASGTRRGTVSMWNVADEGPPLTTKGHQGMVMSLVFSPDGKYLASAGTDKVVRVWQTENGEAFQEFKHPDGPVYTVAFHPKSQILATAGWDGRLRLFDLTTGAMTAEIPVTQQDIWSIAFSADGQSVYCACQDQSCRVVSVTEKKETVVLRWHTALVQSVACSIDGQYLASGGRDGIVNVWTVESLK